ncbi:NmrA family NAD(P)-binding protein [Candidatus Bathyarchaeota archaeon]|nr:NmrA family NAD(P)-binding protein [Candidatus Bathyarchaeota archaeon]
MIFPRQPLSGKYIWLQPSIGSAKLPIAGQTSANVGIAVEAIVSNPELTKGKYVPLVTDYLSFEEVIKEWSAVTGKDGVYSEVSDAVVESIWGIFGTELASQFRWSEKYPDWAACKPEDEVVSLEKLGIREKVVGLKAALEAMKDDL